MKISSTSRFAFALVLAVGLSLTPESYAAGNTTSLGPDGRVQLDERLNLAVTVTLHPKAPGPPISTEFSGLSYETASVLPGRDGHYLFSPTNQPLIHTFQTLGIKNLRIGGNTVDRATVKIPAQADLDNLFAFAKAAGVKVIYTFRLKDGDPVAAAQMAKYLMNHYKSTITSFTIGNEPNMYVTNSGEYADQVKRYYAAITAPGMAPKAKFCGASATPGKKNWAADFANDFGHDKRINLITQHAYFGGAANRMTNAVAARDKLLSPDLLKAYENFYGAFMPVVISNKLTCRFEEANSYFNGGARGASDAYASALWVLDYMHWWAARGGTAGFNFHMAGVYRAFEESPSGYSVCPLGYGMKAFDLGSHGRIVTAGLTSNSNNVNLTAYGVRAWNTLYVTLINKEHDAGGRDATVTIAPGGHYARGSVMFLTAPDGDVGAKSGLTLGGAPIKDDATWNGTWTSLAQPSRSGAFTVIVPAASAAVVKLTVF